MPGKSALIFGASGVTGWTFVNEILNDYPRKGIWDKVHALTNRPLSQKDSFWPDDSRLNIVSGIDLLKGTQDDLETELKSKVSEIDKVTHVYFLAFKASTDVMQELEDMVNMFKRSTTAIDHLSPNLEFVVLQTGSKWYGIHLTATVPDYGETPGIKTPFKEDMPRLKKPYDDMLFYHPQIDWITEYAKDKKWNWCDTRPDIIIGFVPNQNFYSLGTVVAFYLSLYRAINGEGAECPYPGTKKAWTAKSILSCSEMIAHQTLYLSLNLPASRKGESFNVADCKYPTTWEQDWPVICKYFGLKGTAPPDDSKDREVRKYIKDNFETWKRLEKEHGLKTGLADSPKTFPGFEYFLFSQL
ncbi:uncharacterized protein PV09_00157 [Verruconis gallopava]|uniref:PRISE-like Rossmann-fold domain-containing protein n=1 Tax=Verruconis gallopava TaxID=253628 RepID=A0A0D2ARS4_9PEZI|nr:uncharacterized protein PV09_00157 [Verruconis gallopava]KIW09230.1 hypothetical protein PV09_00157 [Verruconis gallopava]